MRQMNQKLRVNLLILILKETIKIAGILIVKKKEITDSENDASREFKECKPLPATSMSSSYAETTDASESSVTNSPNIRATKSKGKKGKKKKR